MPSTTQFLLTILVTIFICSASGKAISRKKANSQVAMKLSANSSTDQAYCLYPACFYAGRPWVSNGNYEAPNGCSAKWFTDKVKFAGFDSCCNQHDLCWNNCGLTQAYCDNQLFNCLNSACKNNYKGLFKVLQRAACYVVTPLYYAAVSVARCFYIEAQKRLCKCL